MTRLQEFEYLLKNRAKFSHLNQHRRKEGLNGTQRLCISLNEHGIEIPLFSSPEEIRTYFTGEEGKCKICKGKTYLKNRDYRCEFKETCGIKCENKLRSNLQVSNNTVHRIKNRKEWKEKISSKLKLAIAEGRFTPNVTNSWCNSRKQVHVGDKIVNVRSSWEEKFLKKNPSFLYEKTRIPYIASDGSQRTYIVDFTDLSGNLYEIKPSSKLGESSEKIKAAEEFCKKNNVKFHIITEKELNEN